MTKHKRTVGQNIRHIRRAAGITPEQFAVMLGCTMQQVFNYENGRTRITEEIIRKAAKILGVDYETIFSEDEPK